MENRKFVKTAVCIGLATFLLPVFVSAYAEHTTHPALTDETVDFFNHFYPEPSRYKAKPCRCDLSQREIAEAYEDIFVGSFDGTERVPVEVYFLDDEETFGRYPWDEWREKMHKSLKTPSSLDSEYLVFVAQTDYPPDGDIRCH